VTDSSVPPILDRRIGTTLITMQSRPRHATIIDRRHVVHRLYGRLRSPIDELMKYGVVGCVAFVVDVGTFNTLQYAGGSGPLHGHPLAAKTVSFLLATTVAYLGNRQWTFRHRSRSHVRREYTLFFALNAVGLGIALSCLGLSHYVLGFTGAFADNVAANVVGLSIATTFRFWSYRRFVFPARATAELNPVA
jgi:putative flippase GtrA